MRLDLLVLENVSGRTITLGDFHVRRNNVRRLRTVDEDEAALLARPAQWEQPFPLRQLGPAEKIAVPLAMVLAYDPESDTHRYGDGGLEPHTQPLPGHIVFGDFTLDGTALDRALTRPKKLPRPEFVYGPSIRVEAVDVDGVVHPIRKVAPTVRLLRNGFSFGSCPYFLGYSHEEQRWIDGGVILYGRNSAARAGYDERPLPAFDGRVRIEERDRETTFLDALHVIATDAGGGRTMLQPRDPRLRDTDRKVVTLDRGDALVVDFEVPPGLRPVAYRLGASGHYVPYAGTAINRRE